MEGGVRRVFLCLAQGCFLYTILSRGLDVGPGCWGCGVVGVSRVRRLNVTMGDVRRTLPCCRGMLNLGYCGVRAMRSRGIGATFLGMNSIGVRLLRPADPRDAVTGFVRGGGNGNNVRRLTFTIRSNITGTLTRTRAANVHLVSGTPHGNTRNLRVTFLRPGSALNILARLYRGPWGAESSCSQLGSMCLI